MKKTVRSYFRTLARGGPVALMHSLRIARAEWKQMHIQTLMDRERELHRASMAGLRAELHAAVAKQHHATAEAARFWRAIRGQS